MKIKVVLTRLALLTVGFIVGWTLADITFWLWRLL